MRPIRLFSLLLIVVIASACASGGGSSGPRRDRNRIVAAEFADLGLSTALQVVRQLRPAWLNPRGRAGLPTVYRNNAPWGINPSTLANIAIERIEEIRFLSTTDANLLWGTRVQGTVILVTTR